MLYELREADFREIRCSDKVDALSSNIETRCDSHPNSDIEGDPDPEGRTRWEKAKIAFTMLKAKIAKAHNGQLRLQAKR